MANTDSFAREHQMAARVPSSLGMSFAAAEKTGDEKVSMAVVRVCPGLGDSCTVSQCLSVNWLFPAHLRRLDVLRIVVSNSGTMLHRLDAHGLRLFIFPRKRLKCKRH